jgi:PPK2 family polyphosphate:nucleotide phosphotransferase
MSQPIIPPFDHKVKLADYDTRYTDGEWTKESAKEQIKENTAVSSELAYRLYAENRQCVLMVLQGMDTSGKDGTIRTVMTGVNPQSFQITSFKQPSAEELDHDFLWRIHKAVPNRGEIGIFNRSHYEDVLIVRVHKLIPEEQWRARYHIINEFESLLAAGNMTFIKCFLHISKDEQRERLQKRLDNPNKRWKFSKNDLAERKLWDEYQRAYEDALTNCNTKHAPWHIIPSDRKWYRNLLVSTILRETLERMNPQFPAAESGLENITVE